MAMEKRLIDADALLQQIEKRLQKYDGERSDYLGGRCSGLDMAREMVENADAVDAVEVVHGHWYEHHGITICSVCQSMFDTDLEMLQVPSTWKMPNYCPNCGAKMDKERGAGE